MKRKDFYKCQRIFVFEVKRAAFWHSGYLISISVFNSNVKVDPNFGKKKLFFCQKFKWSQKTRQNRFDLSFYLKVEFFILFFVFFSKITRFSEVGMFLSFQLKLKWICPACKMRGKCFCADAKAIN